MSSKDPEPDTCTHSEKSLPGSSLQGSGSGLNQHPGFRIVQKTMRMFLMSKCHGICSLWIFLEFSKIDWEKSLWLASGPSPIFERPRPFFPCRHTPQLHKFIPGIISFAHLLFCYLFYGQRWSVPCRFPKPPTYVGKLFIRWKWFLAGCPNICLVFLLSPTAVQWHQFILGVVTGFVVMVETL